jgi:hypothetical protein
LPTLQTNEVEISSHGTSLGVSGKKQDTGGWQVFASILSLRDVFTISFKYRPLQRKVSFDPQSFNYNILSALILLRIITRQFVNPLRTNSNLLGYHI